MRPNHTTIAWVPNEKSQEAISILNSIGYGVGKFELFNEKDGLRQVVLVGARIPNSIKQDMQSAIRDFSGEKERPKQPCQGCPQPEVVFSPEKYPKRTRSLIGSHLHDIIAANTGNKVICPECQREIDRLNRMTSGDVLAEIVTLAAQIVERSKTRAEKWYHRVAATFLPHFVEHKVVEWIKEACLMNDNKVKRYNLRWMYGMTTVPERAENTFRRTLESLMNAGFEEPRLFVDNCTPLQAHELYGAYNLPITCRPLVRTAGNWVLTLYELWALDSSAERYAVFQDDFVTVKNLKRYLELGKTPPAGYQNLYTFPSNQSLAPEGYTGWYEANQFGRGAVALVFTNEAVRKLLGQPYLVERFQCTKRGHKAIDGGIVDAFKLVGYKEFVHTPSLVQHIGDVSTMGNKPHLKAISFPGEDFDALTLL